MSIEAMKMALEALEADEQDMVADKDGHMVFRVDVAITALRQALETEQEPVAEIQTEDMGKPFNAIRVTAHFYAEVPAVGTKLYKAPPKRDLTCVCGAVWDGEMMVHPPKKREWVGLHGSEVPDTYKYDVMFMEGWLWAEERLKEKNT